MQPHDKWKETIDKAGISECKEKNAGKLASPATGYPSSQLT
jgi:hypothetical protein